MHNRIIFGDNQFFGINHMSHQKAQALAERFRELSAITDVIDTAYECGIHAFMLNTNERAGEICDYLRANADRYPDLVLYPSMPYAHKYANAVANKGIFGTLREYILANKSAGELVSLMAKGGAVVFEKDMLRVMEILVDIEMQIFDGLRTEVVFLQNIVADLLLGFGVEDVFLAFAEHLRTRGVEPGFVTMNMPAMVELLDRAGVKNPVVCSAINKAGYFMNPDIETYERTLRERDDFRPMAMSVLASGAIAPREAIEYVCKQPRLEAVVFGASSRAHIVETRDLINAGFGAANASH